MSELNGEMPQLEMLWPTHMRVQKHEGNVRRIPVPPLQLARGYSLRIFRPGDDDGAYLALMAAAGFDDWSADRLILYNMTALPNGWFLAVDGETDAVVATAMATHRPAPYHPFGGELGWVAAHPDHRGRKLGWTVCAAVTNRLLQAGYENIYLKTDDWRLPAILTYLRMGYVPFLYSAGMAARWQSICTLLDWPYTADDWSSVT
jgi:mycothiol synthase